MALPHYARPLIAALLAFRHQAYAQYDDLLFVHPEGPRRSPSLILRKAVERALAGVNVETPWMQHEGRNDIDHVGHSWLRPRGLSIHHLPAPLVNSLIGHAAHREHLLEAARQKAERFFTERQSTWRDAPPDPDPEEFDPGHEKFAHLWE